MSPFPVGLLSGPNSTICPAAFRRSLLQWFDQGGRRWFPWRETTDPYAVWVAEMLLQQTTARLAAGVWPEFMRRFPTVHHLAGAALSDIAALTDPLGLVYRAERLHRSALAIVEQHGGLVPSDPAGLMALPGVGRYVTNAVRCFAFSQPVGLIDPNVIRVFHRLLGVHSTRPRPYTDPELWAYADSLVDSDRPRAYNWALLDFGATVCSHRSPHCAACVFTSDCPSGRQEEQG